MNPRVCVCCGELISERGGAFSPNPNICASCSSLLDAIDDGKGWARDVPPETNSQAEKPASTSNTRKKKGAARGHEAAAFPRQSP